jgi:ribonuclease HII
MKKVLKKPSDFQFLIGIDEVGRGPIAGPVAVGAFCVLVENLPEVRRIFRGVKESKQLSERQREAWFGVIGQAKKRGVVDFAVAFQSERIIDAKGLSYAIKSALETSLNEVVDSAAKKFNIETKGSKASACAVLLDGGLKAPAEFIDQKTIIKGDEKETVIALASICAKVLRDRRMSASAKKHPQYGLERHKGYGTQAHYGAIKKYGIASIHRKSFLKRLKRTRR